MTHWPATLSTALTLIVGGGLAMAGQALADRRARRREREGRRESFLIQNFAAQQEALMKLQELATKFSARVRGEDLKRLKEGDYKPFDSGITRRMGENLIELLKTIPQLESVTGQLDATSSKEEKDQAGSIIMQIMEHAKEVSEKYGQDSQLVVRLMDKRADFLGDLHELFEEIMINSYRTGSPSVMAAARSYIDAAYKYNGRIVTKDMEKYSRAESAALIHLQNAIGQALKTGPFD
jgi:hypothetical protein